MKILVIYDSLYGNTEKIAQAMGEVFEKRGEVSILRVGQVTPDQLSGIDLLVVGSPTQQFRSTQVMRDFLESLTSNSLKGVKVAAFDTRLTWEEIEKSPPLPFFERIFGYAASRIGKALRKKGGMLVVEPEGFFVEGMKGPLGEGEEQRAQEWAAKLFA